MIRRADAILVEYIGRMAWTCSFCGKPIYWREGARSPLDASGERHSCEEGKAARAAAWRKRNASTLRTGRALDAGYRRAVERDG